MLLSMSWAMDQQQGAAATEALSPDHRRKQSLRDVPRAAIMAYLFFWHHPASTPSRENTIRPGRNEPCLCGSGKKYKKCCGAA
jgi:uncharacterized protein YecA (UPF0149 family)